MTRLNLEQKTAVETVHGRVLVLAGAGSGKTSVLISRCIHLIENHNVHPSHILGLTFTNKAAEEMRHRIKKRLGKESSEKIILLTFHSFCFHILKHEIHHLGYNKQFSLYDEKDMLRLTQTIEKQEGITSIEEEIAKCMKAYNAVDFDGLLSLTVELFKTFPEILKKYQNQFSYIMVDEYQDTNLIQYELVELLAKKHNNILVVGDDDQSIYSWRGAEVKHILNFPHKTLIKLEQNYRSTKQILDVANNVIKNNVERHQKVLWSQQLEGDKVHIFHATNEQAEAEAVVERIVALRREKNLKWSDFAILYRSNNLSRPFEMALLKKSYREKDQFVRGIPYRVVQGTEFYERTEIKDLLAYLKVICNPQDQTALLRIINYPRRGISPKTIDTLTAHQKKEKSSLWNIFHQIDSLDITPQAKKGIEGFCHLIRDAQKKFETMPLKDAFMDLILTLDYKRVIEEEVKSEKARAFKWDNVLGLHAMIESYESETPSLHDFLNTTLLDQNKLSHQKGFRDEVHLLTFHSAKGLEFPACFLVALEDRYLPHEKSVAEGGLEEERRLFYVAITRARKYLTLSMAQKRTLHGKEKPTNPSRFLFEIPKELLTIEHAEYPSPFLF